MIVVLVSSFTTNKRCLGEPVFANSCAVSQTRVGWNWVFAIRTTALSFLLHRSPNLFSGELPYRSTYLSIVRRSAPIFCAVSWTNNRGVSTGSAFWPRTTVLSFFAFFPPPAIPGAPPIFVPGCFSKYNSLRRAMYSSLSMLVRSARMRLAARPWSALLCVGCASEVRTTRLSFLLASAPQVRR